MQEHEQPQPTAHPTSTTDPANGRRPRATTPTRGVGWATATKRRPWILGGSIVLVGAIISGGILWSGQATHDTELTAARTAVSALGKAEILQRKASIDLQGALDAAHAEAGVLAGIVADGAAYSDQDTITALGATTQTLIRDIGTYIPKGAAGPVVPEPETATVTRIFPSSWDTARIHTTKATLERATAAVTKNTRKLTAATKQLGVLTAETSRTLIDVAEASPAAAAALLATLPSADQPSRDGLQTALTTLQAGIDMPGLATLERGYIDAMKAVQASHVAVETQRVIDEAAAAGADTYVDPGSGERKPSPNRPSGNGGGSGESGSGSGSGSGGGSSSGGSSSGGSEDSGGATPAPSRPSVVSGSSTCSGDGGSSWSSYNNTVIVIPGSGVASTSGVYDSGSGWSIDWTCS